MITALVSALALFAAGIVSVPAAHAAGTTITASKTTYTLGEPVIINYETDQPGAKNWISLYNMDGPEPSPSGNRGWGYAPDAAGSVTIPTDSGNNGPEAFTAGEYKVYMLFDDGYGPIAGPISITVLPPQPRFEALVDSYRAQDGRVGEPYSIKVDKFFFTDGSTTPSLTVTSGPSWLSPSGAGLLEGTPETAGDASVTITATLGSESQTVTLTLPIKDADEPLADEFTVLTYNTWQAGSHVTTPREKELRLFLGQGADVVTLQEEEEAHAISLAADLGWDVQVTKNCQSNGAWCAVMSRYPLTDDAASSASVGALVDFDESYNRDAWVFSSHLAPYPYGPYAARDGHGVSGVLDFEEDSGRVDEIIDVIANLDETAPADGSVPSIYAGDMNAPSHLDWIEATQDSHFGLVVDWPVSTKLAEAGFIDSFREIHPDPVTTPANSWSPRETDDVQDRIDFIYQRGSALTTVNAEYLDGGDLSEWTSDHGSFVTTFAWATEAAQSADLSALLVEGHAVPGFDASKTSYNVELDAGTTQVPQVSATTADGESAVTITQASALPGSAHVTVRSPRGTLERVYAVNFTVAAAPVIVVPTPDPPVTKPVKVKPVKVKAKIGKITILKGKRNAKTIKRGVKAKIRVKFKKVHGVVPMGKVVLKVGKKTIGKAKIKRIGKKYFVVIKTKKKVTKRGKLKVIYKGSKHFSPKKFTTKITVR